ncbi:MAG TPA: hypothetical protein VF272_01465 [Candidatus Saccharimonadia bacterium]
MTATTFRFQFQRIIAVVLAMTMALAQPYGIAQAADPSDDPPVQTVAPADPSAEVPPADNETADTPLDSTATPTPAPAPPIPPVDPQPITGPSGPTGVQGVTGPTEPTGPGGPTGKVPDYAFNDALQKWEPTISSSFKWSEDAHNWVSPFYRYDPVVGWWHTIPGVTPSDSINALTANSKDPSALMKRILGMNDPEISNTGPNSTNQASVTDSRSVLETLLNNSGIYNDITSGAASGDAGVSNNTDAGDAKTGLATIVTNLLNILNAMWTFGSGGLSYFVENIYGNQTGDIAINPQAVSGGGGQLGQCAGGLSTNTNTGPNSTNIADYDCSANLEVNSQTTGTIVNNVDIDASSGDAAVTGNTKGGSAMSGDVLAELNIINLINTAIGAGQSFFGIINIFGNLDGDILFPSLNINGVVASSQPGTAMLGNSTTGPGSTNTATNSNSNTLDIDNNVDATFNNNIDANAQTGTAAVANNTEAGSATTGNAKTHSSLFNLFNTNIFGDNAVLVIVNNMGRWFGTIMNLGGSGESGGGLLTSNAVVQNANTGPGSVNEASVSNTNNTEIDNKVTGSITNNITINATSGDAMVSGNTKGGNATSGNATIASSIANIFNSALHFGKVFGILFINVFGTWNGSVGIDTAAGTAPVSPLQLAPLGVGGASFASTLGSGSGSGSSGPIQPAFLASNADNASVATVSASVQSLPNAVQAAIHNPDAAAASTRSTGLLIVLAAFMMLLAGGVLSLDRRLKSSDR